MRLGIRKDCQTEKLSTQNIADGIRQAIYTHTYEVFDYMEFKYTVDDIVIDYSNASSKELEAIFYIKTVKNVKRAMWYEVVDFILENRTDLRIDLFKKRTDKNVHFHLKYTKDPINNPVYETKTINPLLRRKL